MKEQQFNTLSDLIDHPGFRSWVLQEQDADYAFWNAWVRENPHKSALLEEARIMVKGLRLNMPDQMEIAKADVRGRIEAQLDAVRSPQVVKPKWRLNHTLSVAASVIGLGVGIWVLFTFLNPTHIVVQTGYGQTLSFLLPDSSEVNLNANSRIEYARSWVGKSIREVDLQGEAYFSVRKHQDKLPFRVYSGDLMIEVLGTEFNVKQRDETAEVVLDEGAVKLIHQESKDSVLLKPGQQSHYEEEVHEFLTEETTSQAHTAWVTSEMIFDETPMEDVALEIESIFGVSVELKGDSLSGRKFTGRIKAMDLDVLLKALDLSLGLEIERDANRITLRASQ